MTEADAKATTTRKAATADKRTVIERMLAVAEEVGVLEPTKSGGVPFAFRGIDAVVASLSPFLKKHGVIVVPIETNHILTQREVGNKVVTKAEVEVTYRFYGANGDHVDAKVPGQADDFADRSTAQAMSVAFRILLLQTFHIAAFGNEEAHSEGVKNDREAAGQAAVDSARSQAPKSNAGVEAVRDQIMKVAGPKGFDGDALNKMAADLSLNENWFNDINALNSLLKAVQEAPEK